MSNASAELRPVAARYAKALFDLAQEKKQLDAVKGDLESVAAALKASAGFSRLVENPVLSRETQSKAVKAVLTSIKVTSLTQDFFAVLGKNRRLEIAPLVAERFAALVLESRNEAVAEVVSAHPLTAAQVKELKQAVKAATGRDDIHVVTKEKPEILGGVIVKVDGKMFDNSIATKISRLATSLKEEVQAQ